MLNLVATRKRIDVVDNMTNHAHIGLWDSNQSMDYSTGASIHWCIANVTTGTSRLRMIAVDFYLELSLILQFKFHFLSFWCFRDLHFVEKRQLESWSLKIVQNQELMCLFGRFLCVFFFLLFYKQIQLSFCMSNNIIWNLHFWFIQIESLNCLWNFHFLWI